MSDVRRHADPVPLRELGIGLLDLLALLYLIALHAVVACAFSERAPILAYATIGTGAILTACTLMLAAIWIYGKLAPRRPE